jgi:N-acetylmuramoyl-L-alanine amidase
MESEIELLKAESVAYKALYELTKYSPEETPTAPQTDASWQIIKLTNDYEDLCKIVESEATGEGYDGKLAVAVVVLNRVVDGRFGNTIHEVIYQPGQFDPVEDGRIDEVVVSEETRRAVDEALVSQPHDALYFMNPKTSGPISRGWARRLELVASVGNHNFYK